jgi:hypothetical protein
MVRRVKVTRHGMTNCPQCHAHIRVAAQLAATVCPFCEAHLKDVLPAGDLGRLSGLSRVAQASRSGVLAASILGLSGLAGCEQSAPAPVYGAPADIMVPDTAEDAGPMPEYGLPADIMVPDTVADATSQPEYGLPADVTEDTKEDVPQAPPYGIPPDAE